MAEVGVYGVLVGFTGLAEYRLRFIGAEQATYYSLYARLPEFFAGGLAALCAIAINALQRFGSCKWFSTVGLLLIGIAVIVRSQLGPFSGVTALLPVYCCLASQLRWDYSWKITQQQNIWMDRCLILLSLSVALACVSLFELLHG